MRILHVNKFLYRRGGAEAYALELAQLQREAGDDVELFGMHHPENLPQPLADTFPAYVEFDPPPAAISERVALVARMVSSSSAERGMAQAVDRFHPDIVHLHNIYHQLSPSVLKPLARAGVPAVMTLHDYKLACPTYSMLDGRGRPCEACVTGSVLNAVRHHCGGSAAAAGAAALEVTIHRWTDAYGHIARFLCPSRFLAGVMQRAGVYVDRLRVLNNFVDTRGLAQRQQPSTRVVYVGRLSHEKGVHVLLEAMKLLPDNVSLDIAGTGPAESDLRRRATELPGDRVRFHGRLERHRIGGLLASAGVVAVPSIYYENQPMAVLEAFASGAPVVASRAGGLTELIVPGVNGELAEVADAESLAERLAFVLADPERNVAMGRAAIRQAHEAFSADAHVRSLRRHYQEVAQACP
jgi:glycosyltransferase involved in cell wall biosynthesis